MLVVGIFQTNKHILMKLFKLILGIVIGIFSLITLIQELGQGHQGAALMGTLTGFVIIGGISFLLIRSGLNENNKNS
ncbi:hypothetical protein GCM10027035_17950 [Emticicia sediminis]